MQRWLSAFMIFPYLMEQYNAQIHCKDIHQHVVSQGLHYIPGSNPCMLCVCDKGSPKWCKSVLCAPPQNCKSFQVGTLCCEFKCLDDMLTAHDDNYDVALRFVASAITAILSISLLFFLFHRLKKRKGNNHQNQQLNEDQRSLNSIGYIAGSLGYLPDTIGYLGTGTNDIEYHYEEASPQYCLWKPPSNYFPQGEAPPPYEEAVRSAQIENDIRNTQLRIANAISNSASARSRTPPTQEAPPVPQTNQSNAPCRHDCVDNPRRQYANIIVEDVTVHNDRPKAPKPQTHRSTYENIPLSSKPAIVPKRERGNASSSGHRRDAQQQQNVDKPIVKIGRYDVIVENARRSEKPDVNRLQQHGENFDKHRAIFNVPERFCCEYSISSSKSLNRELSKLKAGERSEHNLRSLLRSENHKDYPSHRTLPKNLRDLLANAERFTVKPPEHPSSSRVVPKAPSEDIELEDRRLTEVIPPAPPNFASPIREPKPKKEDELSLISYRCLSSSPDDDDYRSECENCKSAGFTIPDGEESDVLNETMTLQRRPLETGEDVPYYRTSLTLPTNTRNTRKSRAVVTNTNRENWFTTVQETSSSEDDD